MSDYLGRIGQFISQGLVQQGMGAQGRFLANKGQATTNKMGEYNLKVAPDKLKLKRDAEDRMMATLYENMRQFDAELPINQRKVAVSEQGNVLEGKRIDEMSKERAHNIITSTLDAAKRANGNLAVVDAFDPATGAVNMDTLKKQVRPAILEDANTDVRTSNRKAYGKEAANTAGERDRALAVHLGNMKQSGATDEEVAAERAKYTDGTSPVKPSGTKKSMADWLAGAAGGGLKKLAERLAAGDIDAEEAQSILPTILQTLEGAKPQQPQAPQPEAPDVMGDAFNSVVRKLTGRTSATDAQAAMKEWADNNAGQGLTTLLGGEPDNEAMMQFMYDRLIKAGYPHDAAIMAIGEAVQ